jgi:hypothetical protein
VLANRLTGIELKEKYFYLQRRSKCSFFIELCSSSIVFILCNTHNQIFELENEEQRLRYIFLSKKKNTKRNDTNKKKKKIHYECHYIC